MPPEAPEIRWAEPVLRHFIRHLHPTLEDLNSILSRLEYVRDHPGDVRVREIVDHRLVEQLEGIEGYVYRSTSVNELWDAYYTWVPDLILVVHVEPNKK
ncbi:MAG: hypothetical protein ABR874_22770 [Candidatus Sulfotelmatobacter sp.]|jgi:hypothetical protein